MNEPISVRREKLASRYATWIPLSVSEHVARSADAWPERLAIVGDSVTLTYRDLVSRADHLAASLVGLGVKPGDRVGLLMRNEPDYMVHRIGVARAGGVTVPINHLLAEDELDFVVNDAELSLLVVDSEIAGRDMLATVAMLLDRAERGAPMPGGGDRVPLPQVVVRGEDAVKPPRGAMSLHDLAGLVDASGLAARSHPQPSDVAEICYTSGSTGFPKGVLLTHDSLTREGYGMALTRGFGDGWRILLALPPFHIFGYAQAFLPTFFVGGTVILQGRFDPTRQLELLSEHRVNDIVVVPAMMQRVLDAAAEMGTDAPDFPDLVAAYISANRVPPAMWQEAKQRLGIVERSTGYGSTEMLGAIMVAPDEPEEVLFNTMGRVKNLGVAGRDDLAGVKYEIRVGEVGDDVEHRVVGAGELHFRGPGISPGYWRRPDQMPDRCTDGWYRSGDVGYVREDGRIVLIGRHGDLFKTGGENVHPVEVEQTICEIDGVHQAVVVGVPDPRWSEAGFAWVVTGGGKPVTELIVEQHCRSRLAPYKVPKHYRIVSAEDIPLTGSGKLHRAELVARAREAIDVG